MSVRERELQLRDMASCFIDIAKIYGHSGIFVHPSVGDFDSIAGLLDIIYEETGGEYYVMMHGDPTCAILTGSNMLEFSARLYEEPEKILEEQRQSMARMLDFAEKITKKGNGKFLDGFTMCKGYCFNVNPYYTPELFGNLIAPVLKECIDGYKALGYYAIKHTDGNVRPILEQIVQCGPHALHSLDPQGGVSLAEVKRLYGNRVAFCGNVNCGLLQTGTDEEVVADVRCSLREGMPGYGYIFSTSNCVYTGLDLERYELMHSVWREEEKYN
jgi:uroporphyrinogen decarboxylase